MRRYDHLERLGHPEVEGILDGETHVFPKLDGTNASAWCEDGEVRCASRNRELSVERDNHGFAAWVYSAAGEPLRQYLREQPGMVVYGEWLVPHTVRTYRDDAWRRFWAFDVWSPTRGYLPYDEYAPRLSRATDVVEPLLVITRPAEDLLRRQLDVNTYLIREGAGPGEGIVVKNYGWRNRYGRQPWAKLVRAEHRVAARERPEPVASDVEARIAEEFVTAALVEKTRAKVVAAVANELGIDLSGPDAPRPIEAVHRGRIIPQLLGRVFHDLVTEESWAFLRKFNYPTVDYSRLRRLAEAATKRHAQDLFA